MRILYVDDDLEDTEVFNEIILEIDPSIDCNTCSRHTEITDYLKDSCPDLVFLDYRMPIIDGKEILKSLKDHHCFSSMKIIMYSTYMSDWDKEECKKLGAYECLQKMGDFHSLCEQISALIKTIKK